MIPKIIHFVWVGPAERPAWADRNVAEFVRLNPGYEIMWHDEELLCGTALATLGLANMHPSTVADLVRLEAMLRYSGWYFDVDTWPLRPVADAELAFGIGEDERTMLSRQTSAVPVNNCVMAAAPGAAGIERMYAAALSVEASNVKRTRFGPDLASASVRDNPDEFLALPPDWFCPLGINEAWKHYQHCLTGNVRTLRRAMGGHLPFALHLWMNKNAAQLNDAAGAKPDLTPYALAEAGPDEHCMSGAAEGIAALGIRVDRYRKEDMSAVEKRIVPPAVLCMWNNIRRRKVYADAVDAGSKTLVMENGFFSRPAYVQVDRKGFLHNAEWARRLDPMPPLPACADERLAAVWPEPILPSLARPDGYVLVIGQVPGDAQLAESPVADPVTLARLVKAAMPCGVQTCFRGHPKGSPRENYRAGRELTPCPHEGLREAVQGARFVVTINSNTAVECLAWGCPVLAFGPATFLSAKVARRASKATLRADLQAMLDGWTPDQGLVEHYLKLLACRQYNRAELTDPDLIENLLAGRDPWPVSQPVQEAQYA